jgi:hypothetical protein
MGFQPMQRVPAMSGGTALKAAVAQAAPAFAQSSKFKERLRRG